MARPRTARLLAALLAGVLGSCSWHSTWPTTSSDPAPTLEHPDFSATLRHAGIDGSAPWRVAILGDQRALADGEFQALVGAIAAHEDEVGGSPPLAAIVDTGDIVDNGRHADQFRMLQEILEPLRRWPYLVAAGNHELGPDLEPEARTNFVRFMGDAPGPLFSRQRLWYRKDAPGVRLLFLDTNEWVYGPTDNPRLRNDPQLAWLSAQMAEDFPGRTVVFMHHPIVSSSQKHRDQSARMWSIAWNDEVLALMFARGGVDLVVSGHTHTYERFRLTAPDGGSFHLVNISGRPRDSFLWIGDGARRARDIRGRELEILGSAGWRRGELQGWTIEQLDGMFDPDTEENQWGELTIAPDGTLEMEMFFLVDRGAAGYESRGRFRID